jgi:hypothetical protein
MALGDRGRVDLRAYRRTRCGDAGTCRVPGPPLEAGSRGSRLFALQEILKKLGRIGRLPAEMIGGFGLTLAAVAGWAVAAGGFGQQALAIWLLNALFAADQILYVQLRIREVRAGKGSSGLSGRILFPAVEALIALLLLGGAHAGWMPWLALPAFLPVLVRGETWVLRADHSRLQINRLGTSELFYSILFGILLIVAFRLPIH